MRAALIIGAYLVGLAAFFAGLTPVWPWMLLACAVLARWNWKAAIPLAAAVLALQFIKPMGADPTTAEHLWVYYGTASTTFGLVALVFFDKVAAATLFAAAGVFIVAPADATEVVFVLGAVGAAYAGPSGGIYSALRRSAASFATGFRSYLGGVLSGSMAGGNRHSRPVASLDSKDREQVRR